MALAHASAASAADRPEVAKYRVYVGTYTTGSEPGDLPARARHGLGRADCAGAGGRVGQSVVPGRAPEPAVPLCRGGESSEFGGEKTGAVSAFTIDAASGTLSLLNQQPSRGPGPVLRDGRSRGQERRWSPITAAAAWPACRSAADGRLAPASSFIQHQGSSVDPAAAEGAARAFDQPRRGESVRHRGRPGPRQAVGLPVRCGDRER